MPIHKYIHFTSTPTSSGQLWSNAVLKMASIRHKIRVRDQYLLSLAVVNKAQTHSSINIGPNHYLGHLAAMYGDPGFLAVDLCFW